MDIQIMKKVELRDVQREKAAAIERLGKLDRERSALDQQINDLAITERTLARMLSVDLPEPAPMRSPELATRKKPVGIPTIYVMTVTLLRDRGDHWMESQEIVQAIRERWWPTAESSDITPTLWRLYKTSGKLAKNGTKYGLPPGTLRAVRELGEPGSVSVQ